MAVFWMLAGGLTALAFGARSFWVVTITVAILSSMPFEWGYESGVVTRAYLEGLGVLNP